MQVDKSAKLSDRYTLKAEIATGGMASVWTANDEVLDRTVAVKILHEHLAANKVLRKRFRIEALAAARLSHPHIVSVFDTGEHHGLPFIVMEYLEGGTLRDLLDKNPVMDPRKAAAIGADVCSALHYAHSMGVIHRDIKPANILFSEQGHVKVADFGIAKAAFFPASLTDTGAVLGTARYLAPEQIEGAKADGRTDVYSLGLVLYEMVTGRASFSGSNDMAMATARLSKLPPRPRDLRPSVPRELDDALMKAISVKPEQRFSDARSFEAVLRGAGGDLSARVPRDVPPRARPGRKAPRAPVEQTSFIQSEMGWLVPVVLIIILTIGIILAVPALRNRVGEVITSVGPGSVQAVEVASGGTFDPPPGDGVENDDQVPNAFDGDPATSWSTVNYRTAELGGLKDGVGIFVDLGRPVELEAIRVSSVQAGFSASIRHSDDGRSFSPPGPSVPVSQDHEFDVSGSHRWWLLWITELVKTPGGSSENPYSVSITEITPLAR